MGRLDGRWCLVTGSSRGIGRQIALGLAREGAGVIVHARTRRHAQATVAELRALGTETDCACADLSDPGQVDRLVRDVLEAHAGVDILYNNAGVQGDWKEPWSTTREDWMAVLRVNLLAMVQLSTAFARGMKERGFGRITNLTSGIREQPWLAPYSVSKAAVDKFTLELACELKGSGVLVNALDPGWLRTDMAGPDAPLPVEAVLPGALVPALLDADGPSGTTFRAQDYRSP